MVKELEAAKRRWEFKLKTLSADRRKDNILTFEELGVDKLFIDEAHCFFSKIRIEKLTRAVFFNIDI
jgi:N12 class adenine-specific DNA methylase